MVRAHSIRGRLLRDASSTIDEVAREENVGPSYVTRLSRLTFLAPDIVTGILTGRHPPELTARKLMADTRLPWTGTNSGSYSAWRDPSSTSAPEPIVGLSAFGLRARHAAWRPPYHATEPARRSAPKRRTLPEQASLGAGTRRAVRQSPGRSDRIPLPWSEKA
jgi:hypothetical protein